MKIKPTLACYLVALAAMLMNSCKSNKDLSAQYTEQDRQDVLYIMQLTEKGRPVPLNMSDERQYRFIKRMFQLSGKTAEEYPQQFRSLDSARELHRTKGVPDEKRLAVASGEAGTKIPMNILTEFGAESQTSFASAALSSIPGGTIMTQISLRLYDTSGNPLGDLATTTEYGEGENSTVRATGTTPVSSLSGNSIKALFAYYYQANDGTPYVGGYTATTIAKPTQIINTDPMPVRHTAATITKICLGRGSSTTNPNACSPSNPQSTDCDYCFNQASYSNVFFPVSGSITYSDSIDAITFIGDSATNAFSYIDVIQFMQGGGCPVLEARNNFFKDPNTKINGKTLTWNLNPANFGAACYVNYGDSLTYNFLVRVNIKGQPVFASISNAKGVDTSNKAIKVIPKIFAVWGCVASGTMIKMADGSTKRIDDINVLEKIVTQGGQVLTVENTTKGNEVAPMYRVTDNRNNTILLTSEHAVPTGRGVLLAKALKSGDKLFTTAGVSEITSITTEKYNGVVWNLDVGIPADKVSLTDSATTFYANNVLVGDGKMQRIFSIRHRTHKEAILERLPKAWHQDYQNHQRKSQ